MDNKGGIMIKKGLVLFILSIFVFLSCGCETLKGVAQGATEGAMKDWEKAKKIDAWLQEHLW
jgi:hypothetical protein